MCDKDKLEIYVLACTVILRLCAILFELETKSSAYTAGVVAHTLRAEGGKPLTAFGPTDPPVNPSQSSHSKVLRLQVGC